ncbi:hypothetical protein PPYR_09652 [Photinus pyralis]|uniref:Sodium-dependent multivitamin transporter n=1 Tax=Photinus pyralis TaxID=7054 RepID=A0A1Y1K127_PHOPY|nr:putative sodium-dependent multivitamin transporter [Photinus pyralis]XP_031343162.1 putative sodium-dependent multivitamin transporter [Photinus pyralis]XP_031343163.1 putative sodium-dependent multivitamin transporter [Photinus pyralis]XP_031343164.1 putative sodium-dependent multivitamin transporter [Photinus pyralis]XP_031343165.1 putative sodium-dependent multivitamin transporter [Photinus pyralis]KAB0798659.1 hypothetical protein PPYR_09652 [Photinus pyralis]
MHSFGVWDYAVLGAVLAVSSAIGVYYRFTGGKQRTVKEYLLADRNMSVTPVAFSLMASFMSAITLLGVSSENYSYGIQFIVINFAYGIFTPIATNMYIPVFYQLQATSAYEYLERRFGKTTRLMASLSYTLQMVLYMGIVLYAPSMTLEALTGISTVTAIIAVGLVCTFYSTIGGMKAVLVTDCFQSLLMFAGIFSVIICAFIDKGSFSEIWRIASEGKRTELFNFDPDPTVRHSWFSLILGGGVTFLSLYAVNQTQIQRYLTVKDLKTAQKALWLNWPILTLLSLTTSFSGLAIYSKYYNCDPVANHTLRHTDQIMPYYVIDSMGHIPGVSGIFISGIFSATLSTVSSAMNCLAAVTVEDYIKPMYLCIRKRPLTENLPLYTKLTALTYGLISIALAFLAQYMGEVLQTSLTIFGAIGGPLLGLFTLGMFARTPNEKGSLVGFTFGLALSLWIAFGGPKPPSPKLPIRVDGCGNPYLNATVTTATVPSSDNYLWLYRVSYLYNGVLGLSGTFFVGYVVSFVLRKVTNAHSDGKDPNLFIPILAKKMRKEKMRREKEMAILQDIN